MTPVFKIAAEDRFPGEATSLSHITTANVIIKKVLTPTQLDMFRRTVFGRFVDMELVFNSPLVHQLLIREVEDQNEELMSFYFRDQVVKFSKEEFLLVTGLWRSPVIVNRRDLEDGDHSGLSLMDKYFGSHDLHLHDMEVKYKELRFEDDEDAVKVSLVYYTELAMFGKDKKKTVVDTSLFEDVYDIAYYNSLDWGDIIWMRTLKGLKNALKDKVGKYREKALKQKKYCVKYSLVGFPLAFQVWAYETLSTACNHATILNENVVPRLLKWSCGRSKGAARLEHDIFNNSETIVNVTLVMSDVEREYRDSPVDIRPICAPVRDEAQHDRDILDYYADPTPTRLSRPRQSPPRLSPPRQSPVRLSPPRQSPSRWSPRRQSPPRGSNSLTEDLLAYMRSIDISLLSIESRVSSLDNRVSRVEDSLGEIRHDLKGIFSTMHQFCQVDGCAASVDTGTESVPDETEIGSQREPLQVVVPEPLATSLSQPPPTEQVPRRDNRKRKYTSILQATRYLQRKQIRLLKKRSRFNRLRLRTI